MLRVCVTHAAYNAYLSLAVKRCVKLAYYIFKNILSENCSSSRIIHMSI